MSLIAVFMALGIGILLGVSMGDSTLVFNQIAVIEELEGKIRNYRQKNEEIIMIMDDLQQQLRQWDYLKNKYLQPLFGNTLQQSSITLIAGGYYPVEIIAFLEESGCAYDAFLLEESTQWKETPDIALFSENIFAWEDMSVSSYGQILWQALRGSEEDVRQNMLMLLQGRGLLEFKQYIPVVSQQGIKSRPEGKSEIILLTGDLPFVFSVLQQGIHFTDNNFVWIAVNVGKNISSILTERPALPGAWFTIENGATYFAQVELWELLYELQK